MEFKVITGFHDVVANKGYREGDTFIVGKTTNKRLQELKSYNNGLGRPLIVEVKKVEAEPKKEEVEENEPKKIEYKEEQKVTEVVLTDLAFDELKAHADEMGIVYAPNIGHDTLLKKFETEGE